MNTDALLDNELHLNEMPDNTHEEEIVDTNQFKFEKPLKRILLIASILLAGELLWMFLITPCLPLTSVDIKTIEGLSRTTILSYSGINSRSSYMSLNALEIQQRLSLLPVVESVEVVKNFPDSVSIIMRGRTAEALSFAEINGLTTPVFFDRNGIIFKIGKPDDNIIRDDLPIVSGFIFENIKPGTRLPLYLSPLLKDISVLKERSPELLASISEIRVNKKVYDGYDLIIYPVSYKVKVWLGHDLNAETLRHMLLLLDAMKERGLKPEPSELDFRTGSTASYTLKD
ncbi:MAG: FtsQ-type POTRA domain-containing protein [Spirochaetaceae bacterium]|jgi:cell division protein FtsQ|nr:FtsQ-type POTRA domain-containing protein [Spirochaetaceae bacterium]